MSNPMKKWGLQGMLLLVVFGGALPLRAQSLSVCNKGTVTVEVVVASRKGMAVIAPYYWVIEGTPIAPGTCEYVYAETVGAYPAYIGFGFACTQGQWGAGTVERVPDMGSSIWGFSSHPIMSRGAKTLCARRDKTHYVLDVDNPETDCATLQQGGRVEQVGQGPLVPLAAMLYFQPESARWSPDGRGGEYMIGGVYYLNVAPKPGDRDVHATAATESGEDRRSPEQLKLDAEQRKILEEAMARASAEHVRHERVVAEWDKEKAVARSDVKSVADYSPAWMSKPVSVKGTVARLEVQPMWVVVHFQESPSGAFVACFRRRLREEGEKGPIFEGTNGRDYSELLGKTVNVYGSVGRPSCAPASAGMDVRWTSQIKVY
jgi:hypothetical protein